MKKFGLLYLNNGRFNGKEVIPSEWVEKSTIKRSGMMSIYYEPFWKRDYNYGYLWWTRRMNGNRDIPFASGHGGQKIVLIPDVNVVLVTQADPDVNASKSRKQHRAIDSLLFDQFVKYFIEQNSKNLR